MAAGRKKHGKWKFWHDNGKFAAIELYRYDTLLEHQYFDEDGNPMDTARQNRKATFVGGTDAWLKWLDRRLIWPPNYELVNGDEAAVVISGTVDESGTITDLYVSTPFYPAFERTALNAIQHSPKWEPAIENNRRVQSQFRQPVIFKQHED
jgi:TonB family protein